MHKGMFRDPDAGTRNHDRICAYVAENAERVLNQAGINTTEIAQVEREVPVFTGSDFLYGFADLIIHGSRATDEGERIAFRALVEVKSGDVLVGPVLRQMKAYMHALRMDDVPDIAVLVYDPATVRHEIDQSFSTQGIRVVPCTENAHESEPQPNEPAGRPLPPAVQSYLARHAQAQLGARGRWVLDELEALRRLRDLTSARVGAILANDAATEQDRAWAANVLGAVNESLKARSG